VSILDRNWFANLDEPRQQLAIQRGRTSLTRGKTWKSSVTLPRSNSKCTAEQHCFLKSRWRSRCAACSIYSMAPADHSCTTATSRASAIFFLPAKMIL